MSNDNPIAAFHELSWGDAYTRYRPLMLRALAGLVRNGFAVAPDEGLDLIHEFFVEAWPGLVRRYDASIAKPETYIFRAFTQFARPQIIKLRRQAGMLADVAHLSELAQKNEAFSDRSFEEQPESRGEMLAAIRSAIADLPPSSRQILLAFLTGSQSERALARRAGVSRYRVREWLIGALGRATEAVESAGALPKSVRNAAMSHWRRGVPLEQSARLLKISVAEIRANRARLLHQLTQTVRQHPSKESTLTGEQAMNVESLFRELLSSPGNKKLLAEARHRSAELVDYLQHNEWALQDEGLLHTFEKHPEWASQIYEALAGEEVIDPEDQAAIEELITVKENDDRSIGQAFRNGLLRDLDPELLKWEEVFRGIRKISKDEQNYLAERPDVVAASPAADALLQYGITPLTIFYAMLAIKVSIDRLVDAKTVAQSDAVLLTANPKRIRDKGDDIDIVPAKSVADEIASMSDVKPEIAWAILRWLVAVAKVRSFAIPQFQSFPEVSDVRLTRIDGQIPLEEGWKIVTSPEDAFDLAY